MTKYYVGLISGTSLDGIDAVLASFNEESFLLHTTHAHAYPEALRESLRDAIINPEAISLDQLGRLDRWTGECFRDAALALIEKSGVNTHDIVAIGSHGQTLRHRPDGKHPFSLQIGDAATITLGTGITTVADFRRADIAAGGQGAPLLPPFHDRLFRDRSEPSVVLNIGGIANITYLPVNGSPVTGFDTGPGNTLLDAWIRDQRGLPFDDGGAWAASGTAAESLLARLLSDDYFDRPPPKSTGFEYFNLAWLRRFGVDKYKPEDVQAVLSELTARSIATAIERHTDTSRSLYVCGGGAHNQDLLRRLESSLGNTEIASTSHVGLDPDWVEAAAFAWLAMRAVQGQSGNLPSVTGANRKVVLGAIHSP